MDDHGTISAEMALTSGELRLAIGRIARRMKQLYEAGEVTFSETSMLSRLDRAGPATPGALAAAEHVRPQAIVAIVNALVLRGLVARSPDPTDGRKVLISLTEAGRQALAEGFSPDEQQQLRDALPLLERLAGML